MKLLEGLDKFGLQDLENLELYAQPKETPKKIEVKAFQIGSYVYEKEFTCPSCDSTFTGAVMRSGKMRPVSIDYDLRPIFREPIQPVFYDVLICPRCGFAALRRSFRPMSEWQRETIAALITPRFKPVAYPLQLTLAMAIERYKLALLCAMIRNARDGEKAYICMKLAWLSRSARDELSEMVYLQSAYTGFAAAYTKENFPICGLDEHTVMYLMAAFAKAGERYDEAMRLVGTLITDRTTPARLKERARDLKASITAERNLKKSEEKES